MLLLLATLWLLVKRKIVDNQEIINYSLYPDPGSNRDGLLHWCLRPARLPIPPSGLNADAKVRIFFLTTKFLGQKITEQILNL